MLESVPSPTTRAFWRQVGAVTGANLKARYRKTVAGFFWVVLNPLIMYTVQALVFKRFLRLDVRHYALFLASGLLPWTFFQQSLEMCTSLFVSNGRMLKSLQFNPLVLLVAQISDNLVNFLATLLLILVPACLIEHMSGWDRFEVLFLLPIPILVLTCAAIGIAWLLATWQVFLRDTRFVVSFALSVSYFLTPIFYPVSLVPPEYRILIQINPIYRLIVPFQILMTEYDSNAFGISLFYASGIACGFLGLAALTWEKRRNDVYFNV
jgi:ABC-type polysaccharide/polyol phosphate export permease